MPPRKVIPKSKPPKIVQSATEEGSNVVNQDVLESEMANQFQLELCWCIQNLQQALASGKLSAKQVQDHTKALNTLMNNSAPMVKRRQVMRLSFGDYRKKMAEDSKKYNKVKGNITLKPVAPSKESVFLKKSSRPEDRSQSVTNQMDGMKLEDDNKSVNVNTIGTTKLNFKPSDNSFQFNFVIDNVK